MLHYGRDQHGPSIITNCFVLALLTAGALLNLLKKKPIESISDEMVILAGLAEMALKEVKAYIQWFLEDTFLQNKRRR